MTDDLRKIAVIGTGFVGMSYAFSLLNQSVCNELLLVDINEKKAMGEALDLSHGLAFSQSNMQIYSGSYSDCKDADIAVICAGAAQSDKTVSRLDLLQENVRVFKNIINPLIASGFKGIILVASNPVDLMARTAYELSGFPKERVLGSGTSLDTARLRYNIGKFFKTDPKNIHAYVMGEHGDSEFVPWSQAYLATIPITEIEKSGYCTSEQLNEISEEVRTSARTIIDAKGATNYGIGMSLLRITKAIFGNEGSIITVSTKFCGEYGINNVFMGTPAYIKTEGVTKILPLRLTDEELTKLKKSAKLLDELFSKLKLD